MGTLPEKPDTPAELLEAAYEKLGFDQGALLSAMSEPQSTALKDWVDRGDWQTLAAQVGAERIFFVDRDPVIVFAKTEDSSPAAQRGLYESIWCMSRPQLLFLATPGQLSVFDLTKPPPAPNEAIGDRNRLIRVATSIAEVQSKLSDYHRERVETGLVFGDERFRADSSRIFVDSFFRYVSENEILFIKRNERRFWTRTAAREDAESALTYLMNSGETAQGGGR